MAKSSNRGGGPGTVTRNSVRGTLDAPFRAGMSTGDQVNLTGTFDQARSGSGNGLPTRVMDRMGGPKAGGTGPATSNSSMIPSRPARRMSRSGR